MKRIEKLTNEKEIQKQMLDEKDIKMRKMQLSNRKTIAELENSIKARSQLLKRKDKKILVLEKQKKYLRRQIKDVEQSFVDWVDDPETISSDSDFE